MTTVIRELDALEYQKVNDLYDIAKEANANISLTRNTLARELQGIETELSKIPHPSAVEQQKLNAVRNIIKKITLQDAEGNIIGLVPIENQVLLDQAKSLRYVLDFDFAHGTPKGIFKPVINALENAVERGATQAGNRKAYTAHNKARKAYKNWTQDYNNDYINKFRDTSNVDYSKNFKTSLDLDSYHPIEKIISRAYPGQQLANATRRELVNKHLGKYIDNPNLAVGEEYQRTINELSNIIGDPVTKEIEQSLAQARRSKIKGQKLEKLEQPKPPKELEIPEKPKKPEAKVLTKPVEIPKFKEPKPTKEMQALSKKLKITPEKIQAKTETPSGLRELKNDLNKTEIGKGQYQRIADSKMKSILQNKKVVGEYTGNELYEVLNQEKNYDLVVELIGESETKDLLKAAKSIAEDKIKGEKIKQLISKETLKSLLLLHLL